MAAVVAEAAPLPPRLMRFFAKHPPALYSAYFTGQKIPTIREKIAVEGDKKLNRSSTVSSTQSIQTSADSSTSPLPISSSSSSPDISSTSQPPTPAEKLPPNPFLPYKNPATGRWRGPRYGLRIQADLVKLARKHGVEPLLPPSRKGSAYKETRILERGLAIKGTGEGQKVKGHKWERTMNATLEKRRQAMEKMPEMIREWEARGHGRGWKKFPK